MKTARYVVIALDRTGKILSFSEDVVSLSAGRALMAEVERRRFWALLGMKPAVWDRKTATIVAV